MTRTYFISDLHLFSRRSLAPRYLPQIHEAIHQADRFILGGDIFDFRWSSLGSPEVTVRESIKWLGELIAVNPAAQFDFILGNHDYNRRFIEALNEFAASQPNLEWHRYYLRLGNRLFLHGDAADEQRSDTSSLLLRRQQWLHDESRHEFVHWLYDMAVRARLHHVAKLIHRNKRVTGRLLNYLVQIGQGPDSGVKHVYFGHTHCSMANFPNGGLLFHNGGAPMQGLEFRIVEVEREDEQGEQVERLQSPTNDALPSE